MKRLVKKADLDLDTILRRLESGEKITFRDRSNEISFQEVRQALSINEKKARNIEDKKEKEELLGKINKVRNHLNKQYSKIEKNIKLMDDNIDVKKEKVMTVFAGTNGSGKSTITQLVREQVDQVIDIDIIMKTKNIDANEARNFSLEIADRFMEKGINFSVETTLRTQHVLKQIQRARTFGYKIVVYYVGLMDVGLNLKRIRERVEKGGNAIPKDSVLSTYDMSLENLHSLIEVADIASIIDNSGAFPVSVEKFEEGKMVYHVDNENAEWIEKQIKGE